MLVVYPAIFHKEDDLFWVEFPDLPGCQSDGESIEQTMQSATEALGLYIYSQHERGIPIPKPSDIKSIVESKDSFATLVSSNPNLYERNTKAVKKTLTIPDWLNKEAESRHINFSSVLKQALIEYIDAK